MSDLTKPLVQLTVKIQASDIENPNAWANVAITAANRIIDLEDDLQKVQIAHSDMAELYRKSQIELENK